ncbi:MAG: hypothetical protein J5961_03120 [Mogibacterium sp.]|nr:hypothetical protein [Mogibacterium sp.]
MTKSGRKIFNMVIAILVAIAAWVFVVYNYDPMTLVTYNDVPVNFTGERDLAERGLAVSATSMETVNVTLSQRRIDGKKISAADITVNADVSDCVAGDNNVTIRVSGPTGTSVNSVSASETDVDVSRAKTEIMDIDVVYNAEAELEEDEEPIAYDLGSTSAEVSSSAEVLSKIDKVAAVLDREDLTDTPKSYTVDLQALDRNGNVLPHVVIDPKEISLDASEGYIKKVNLYLTVKDESDDSYERKWVAPETVTIKGTESVLNKVNSITAEEIDVTYRYEDEEIEINYDLPEGIYIADESLDQRVKLTVTQKKDDEDE